MVKLSEQQDYCNYCGKILDNKSYCGDKHKKLNELRKQQINAQIKNGLLHR